MIKKDAPLENATIEGYDNLEKERIEVEGEPVNTRNLEDIIRKIMGEKKEEKPSLKDEVMSKLNITINIGDK